ncbi:MAG: OsmC family protein [Nitrospinota bacterium]|nr:OsmC family protein [Nitrospinota bacterium]
MSQESLKAALLATIGAIKEKPESGRAVFRSETKWISDTKCEAKVRDFGVMTIDEPPELGGGNAGPNPVELLLAALGTCQEIMYAAYASVMGVELTSLKVDVKGYLDLQGLFGMNPDIPSGYSKIQYVTNIESPADEATIQQLIQTVESHCPVLDTLVRAIEVTGEVKHNGKKLTLVEA